MKKLTQEDENDLREILNNGNTLNISCDFVQWLRTNYDIHHNGHELACNKWLDTKSGKIFTIQQLYPEFVEAVVNHNKQG